MKKGKKWQLTQEDYANVFGKIIDDKFINYFSKSITAYAFRNGPIEDMHANPKMGLGQKEMKILNKYMVNRLAGLFMMFKKGEFESIEETLRFHYSTTTTWDDPEPDITDFELLRSMKIIVAK